MHHPGRRLATAALLALVACESAPTFPDSPAIPLETRTEATFSTSGSVVVNEATVSHYQAPNGDEFVTFSDTEGNWYRMEALYDSYGRMREFRTWVNGEHLGTDNPSWSGMERLQHFTTNGTYWTTTSASAYPIAQGLTSGGGGGEECPPNGCDNMESRSWDNENLVGENGPMYIYNPCSEQWRTFGLATAEMIFSQVAFGGAILASSHPIGAPGAPWMVGSTMGYLATSAIRWHFSTRSLDRCLKPWRYNDQ
ncbi:hypothetical protein BH23GEM8_BH23GEM8_20360 [soil metagenome]